MYVFTFTLSHMHSNTSRFYISICSRPSLFARRNLALHVRIAFNNRELFRPILASLSVLKLYFFLFLDYRRYPTFTNPSCVNSLK